MKRVVLFALMCTVVAWAGSDVHAACAAGSPTPIFHALGGFLQCDDSGRVQAFAYQLGSPSTTNSGPLNIACASPAGPSLTCTGSSPGVVNDGMLTVETDATIVGWNGCPVTANGPQRLMVVAIDSSGNSAMLSVSGNDPNQGYFLEMAHPIDSVSGSILPISCAPTGRPKLLGVSNNGTTVNLQLTVPPAAIHSDCDAGSVGRFVDSGATDPALVCNDNFVPSPVTGRLYTSTQPCGFADITQSKWVASAITPDAAGNASISAPSPTGGNCLYVAASAAINGNTELFTGFVSVGGNLASPPKAENLSASSASGKVTIRWSTSTEVGLATFKVIAQSKSKTPFEVATVAPKGNGGGATYAVSIGMGEMKGARSVIVRSILTDGTSIDSAVLNF